MFHDRDFEDGIRGQFMCFSNQLFIPVHYFVLQLHTDVVLSEMFCLRLPSDQFRL